jgi:predicted metal-binding protein
LENNLVKNPYEIYQRVFSLKELTLDFDYRVAAMCQFGCKWFGKKATCPPNVYDFRRYKDIFDEYTSVNIIGRKYPYSDGLFLKHWRGYSTNEIHSLLLKKEAELFRKGNVYAKAFIGGSCKLCPPGFCSSGKCRMPQKGRAPVEATGLSVFSLMEEIKLEYQEPPVDYFWRMGLVFY